MKLSKISLILAAAMTLTMTACHDDEGVTLRLNASLEQPTNADGSKVYMQDERYIYWEEGDNITIASDQNIMNTEGTDYASATLVDASTVGGDIGDDFGFFNGVFLTTLEGGSQYFLGIHPKIYKSDFSSDYCTPHSGSTDFGTVSMKLAPIQPRRTDAKGDLTFNKNIYPMVAWYGGTWTDSTTAYNLDFHSVASIVRLQLANETGSAFTLDSIVISSRNSNHQLSGIFTVKNYKTEDPSLTAKASPTAAERTITLATNNGGTPASMGLAVAASGEESLPSFYLVLPAYKGRHDSTQFSLTMKVCATVSGEAKTFSRNFSVNARRNGITYMPAIGITDWTTPTTEVRLVGNGTEARPFKIYTRADLQYLRDCYNSTARTINNQAITSTTEIRIMRSDIELHGSQWSTGIQNFTGHIRYTTTGTNSSQVIVNNGLAPLFESISSDGTVEGITVKCDTNYTTSTSFSPFCSSNQGTITNCHVTGSIGKPSAASNAAVAGVCLTNRSGGKIIGSDCRATLNAPNFYVSGVCYTNYGTIEGCYVSSPMKVTGAVSASGVCYSNHGTVKDCYFSIAADSVGFAWGGIVYDNQSTIEHCYMRETASITSSAAVGGIANTNSGTINYCWAEGLLKGNGVGLITAFMTSGSVINCFCNNSLTFVTLHSSDGTQFGGGLVGRISGGSIQNSYVYIEHVQRLNSMGYIGGLVGGVIGTTATITNCYVYESGLNSPVFYGYSSSDTPTISNCYLVGGSGSETGVTNVTTTVASSSESTGLTALLNANKPSGGYDWQLSGSVPVLAAYTRN